jgi:hypothetical protein
VTPARAYQPSERQRDQIKAAAWGSERDEAHRFLAIEMNAALRVIARCSRWVEHSQPIPESDDLELGAAFELFDVPGTWRWASDASLVRSLDRARCSGRRLEPIDLDRLRRIVDRVHQQLERNDQRAPA